MDDSDKTREELIHEIQGLRRKLARSQGCETGNERSDGVEPQGGGLCDHGGDGPKGVRSAALFTKDPTGELLRSHERERQLIAYEIHDGLVQDVTGAQMHLEALLGNLHLAEGRIREEIALALDLVRKAVVEARGLIRGLRPPALDEWGLAAGITCLLDDQPADGPEIEFVNNIPLDRLEPLLEGTIYRIVQEAITNVRRHSKSDRAMVRLVRSEDRIHLEIRDWGVGFNPAKAGRSRFGLEGIRERARLLHGWASIESAPGQGTRILVDLPAAGASEHHELVHLKDRSTA
jgi:signal transduction histidine kinase